MSVCRLPAPLFFAAAEADIRRHAAIPLRFAIFIYCCHACHIAAIFRRRQLLPLR